MLVSTLETKQTASWLTVLNGPVKMSANQYVADHHLRYIGLPLQQGKESFNNSPLNYPELSPKTGENKRETMQ